MGPTGADGTNGTNGNNGNNGNNGTNGTNGATGATGSIGPSYSASARNAAAVTLTNKGVTPPTCAAGDVTIATLTVPVSPGGISGTYSLSLDGAGSIVAAGGGTVVGSITLVVDGTLQGAVSYSTSTGTTRYYTASTNVVASGLSAASSHTVKLVGCGSTAGGQVAANSGTLSVTATN